MGTLFRVLPADILARFDRDERINAEQPGLRREVLPNLIRQVGTTDPHGVVIHSSLTGKTAPAAIEEQIVYFSGIHSSFEWKVYGHDAPPNLAELLATRGFALDDQEAVMVLDIAKRDGAMTHTVQVRRLNDTAELSSLSALKRAVYGNATVLDSLAREMQSDPLEVSVYVAYAAGEPAACGWVRYVPGSAFAGLWGGSTHPHWRGQGLYSALVEARLEEAVARGRHYATVDAGSMSRPILERRGFVSITSATACEWPAPES